MYTVGHGWGHQMTDVFISYSHENKEAARVLADVISSKGFDVWWDRDLIAGDDYTTVIESVLDQASAVIVIWSAASRKSYWVRDEAAVGRDRNRLLPVTIDDNPPPLGFRQIHTVALRGWDGKDESWLEDIFLGLKGLASTDTVETPEAPIDADSSNPFGAPDPAPAKTDKIAHMFAGVNARPNQKSINDIRKEEKRQRSFLRTFWVTSLILGSITSLLLGLYANMTDSFAGAHWLENVAVAAICVGSGLIIGRFLIAVGRRLSKRKSVQYFDYPTIVCIITSVICSILIFLGSIWETQTVKAETPSDALFLALVTGFVIFFPVSALVSLVIGATNGRNRTSFNEKA